MKTAGTRTRWPRRAAATREEPRRVTTSRLNGKGLAGGVCGVVPNYRKKRKNTLELLAGRTLVAFALTLGLLALLYNVFASLPFTKLRIGDLVMHKAYATQVIAFTLLWLALLK